MDFWASMRQAIGLASMNSVGTAPSSGYKALELLYCTRQGSLTTLEESTQACFRLIRSSLWISRRSGVQDCLTPDLCA